MKRRILIAAFLCAASPTLAQTPGSGAQGPTPYGAVGGANGHVQYNCAGPPALTGGSLTDGSNDCWGGYTSSATSGSITFAVPFMRTPFCTLDAQGATQPTYTVTPTGITISVQANTTAFVYECVARPGG